MKILYVANHNSGGNDDEGAIAHALKKLGHNITCIPERIGKEVLKCHGDFILFHKWYNPSVLDILKIPKVFWYFDLVNYDDEGVQRRNQARINWMAEIVPRISLGFCTDGDWVLKDTSGKLIQLSQGADERYVGRGMASGGSRVTVLFVGNAHGGSKRMSHIRELKNEYRENFGQVTNLHQRRLADKIASANVVIAPDSPITDNYWSNRVYLMLGFGAFLLHPYAESLSKQYTHKKEIVYYTTRKEVYELVEYYRLEYRRRRDISDAALKRTKEEHTYTHRCERLIQLVRERLF